MTAVCGMTAPSPMSFPARILQVAREAGFDAAPLLAVEADARPPGVAGIAARVGFSEPSAFYRAVRRWTGERRVRDRRARIRGV